MWPIGKPALVTAVLFSVVCLSLPCLALYVDPVNGDDSNDGSSWGKALKTITKAGELSESLDTTNVFLAEGVFSEDTGEVFPITLYNLESISGISRDKTVIDVGLSLGIFVFDLLGHEWHYTASIESLGVRRSGPVDYCFELDPPAFEDATGSFVLMEFRDVDFLGLSSFQEAYEGQPLVGPPSGGSVIIIEIWLFICFVGVFFERLSSVQIRVG